MRNFRSRKTFAIALIVVLLLLGITASSVFINEGCCPTNATVMDCSVHKTMGRRLIECSASTATLIQVTLVFAFVLAILFTTFSVSDKSLINLKIRLNT